MYRKFAFQWMQDEVYRNLNDHNDALTRWENEKALKREFFKLWPKVAKHIKPGQARAWPGGHMAGALNEMIDAFQEGKRSVAGVSLAKLYD
jgi:hypothetical protein